MKFKPLMIAAAFLCTSAYAEVSITTGAGYMPMSKELAKAYQQATGQKAVETTEATLVRCWHRLPLATASIS